MACTACTGTTALLVSLQRGEPDVFVNPDDAAERGVADGDLVRVYNNFGSFVAQAQGHARQSAGDAVHVPRLGSNDVQGAGELQFGDTDGRFVEKEPRWWATTATCSYKPPVYVPNQTYHDATCEFEKYAA